ncbi:hypothetical protein F4861DRAFT_542572 [Xylaria intraflava]|nr:hypothetical protein F4861DRAFT_542572 [Xylaria intraflava]
MSLVFDTSPQDALYSPLARPFSPETTSAARDISEIDWLSRSQTEEAASSFPIFTFPLDTTTPVNHLHSGAESARRESRRHALGQSPIQRRQHRRHGSVLSTGRARKLSSAGYDRSSSYNSNPYVSALIPGSRKAEHITTFSKEAAVQRIASKLLSREYLLGLPALWGGDDVDQVARYTLRTMPDALLKKMIASCFNEPLSVGLFLDESDINRLVQKYRSSADTVEMDESDAIDSFLLTILVAWGATVSASEHAELGYAFNEEVIRLYHAILSEAHTAKKFLALVCISQYAFKVGLAQCPAILAQTVSVVQSLDLHLESGLEALSIAGPDINGVKRACWVLFCVDKMHAMRWRTFSLLPGIEYDPPPFDSDRHVSRARDGEIDWLPVWCSYAKICCRIISACLSTAGVPAFPTNLAGSGVSSTNYDDLTASTDSFKLMARRLLAELKTWYSSALAEAQLGRLSQSRIGIITAYRYYEAVLAVLGLLNSRKYSYSSLSHPPVLETSSGADATPLEAILLDAVKKVLTMSHSVLHAMDDRTLVHVPTLALCSLVVEYAKGSIAISNPRAAREFQTLFAMAYGLFGRLAPMLPNDDFFDSITELLVVVTGWSHGD